MIVHTENPKESTKENFLKLMSEFRRWQYKRSTHTQSHAYILTGEGEGNRNKNGIIYTYSKENEMLRYTFNKTCTASVWLKIPMMLKGNQRGPK